MSNFSQTSPSSGHSYRLQGHATSKPHFKQYSLSKTCPLLVNGSCMKLGGNQTQNNHAADTALTMNNKQKYSTIMTCDSFQLNEAAPNKGEPLPPFAFSWPIATVKPLTCPSFQHVLQMFSTDLMQTNRLFDLHYKHSNGRNNTNQLELQQKKQASREYQTKQVQQH